MNMYVPVAATVALLLMPRTGPRRPSAHAACAHGHAFCIVVAGNAFAFSVLGGALLTRYLLPVYPLVLLVCVAVWRSRVGPDCSPASAR